MSLGPTVSKFVTVLLVLYVISLTLSNAGMEIFSVFLNLTFLGALLFYKYTNSRNKLHYQKLGPDPFLWGFWFVGFLGAFFATNMTLNERIEIVGEFRWILFFYTLLAVLLVFQTQQRLNSLLKLLFLFAGIVGIYSCLQFCFGWDPFRDPPRMHPVNGTWWRAKGFFQSPMTYSYSFGMLFCLMLATCLRNNLQVLKTEKEKWLLWISTGIVGLSLLLTFTRGLWIALGAALLVMTFLHSRRSFAAVLATLVIGISALYQTSPSFEKRVDSIFNPQHSSTSSRFVLWESNFEMFKDHPIIGVGFGRNSDLSAQYNEQRTGKIGFVGHAHNHFIQILSGTGTLGFLAFIGAFGFFFYQAFSSWKNSSLSPKIRTLALGSIGAQIVFHIGGLTEAVFIDNEVLHMFIFIHCTFLATKLVSEEAKTVSTELA